VREEEEEEVAMVVCIAPWSDAVRRLGVETAGEQGSEGF